MMMLLRKVDRAGVIDDIDDPVDDLALITGLPAEHVKAGLQRLLDSGAVEINSERLILPNFIEAQEASKSDRQRQRESRDRRRTDALVTNRDEKSQAVTDGHNVSLCTVPSCAVPSSALQCSTVEEVDAGAAPDAAPSRKKPKKVKRGTQKAKSTETWNAYGKEYTERYGAEPVRNARTNALCCQLVDRLGATDAPLVAGWYVWLDNNWYANRGHSLAALVADCEKIRTEWATGRQITTKLETPQQRERREQLEQARQRVKDAEERENNNGNGILHIQGRATVHGRIPQDGDEQRAPSDLDDPA